MNDSTISKDAVVVERIFDALVDVIWQMWTEPEHFKQWYGPNGAAVPVAEMDIRPGGKHRFCMEMQTAGGSRRMWSIGEYVEVVPNERLVYTDSPSDENGNLMSATDMGMPPGTPTTTQVTVVLVDLGERTKMTVTHTGVPAGAGSGWQQAFDKMAEHIRALPGKK
jgi:uncharacterized protein YndB with AHSA1/START domain